MEGLNPRENRVTHLKTRAFLAAYSRCGSVSLAAKRAKIPRKSHYRWLKDLPGYREEFDAAYVEAVTALEDALYEEAVGSRNITAIIFALKGAMPEKYGDKVKFTGSLDVSLIETLRARRIEHMEKLKLLEPGA